MQRQRPPVGAAQRVDAQQLGDACATRHVSLLHVDRLGLEHPREVGQVVAVLAGRHLHAGRGALAHSAQPREVVGRDRLLEPTYRALLGEVLRQRERLRDRVGAVGIDKQLDVGADRLPRAAHP